MKLSFLEGAWEDYLYWSQTDKGMLKKINQCIKDCMRAPFCGIGKPEPLRFDLSGCWSRRLTHEHRFIYKIEGDSLIVIQCRYHY